MTTTIQSINASASPEVQMNENFFDVAPAAFLSQDHPNTTGLIFAVRGGEFYNGASMNTRVSSTVALIASGTNFLEMTNGGSLSVNTVGFTAGRRPLYTLGATPTTVQSIVDNRLIAWMDSLARFTRVDLDCTNMNTSSVGAVTINKALGRVNIAQSGTSIVVSNDMVTGSSHVFAQLGTADPTGRVNAVVAAAGFFTAQLTAVSSLASINFWVAN